MSWSFNPPPGWPVPPGWQPPSGWTPEPGWPPAPAGWQFWVPADSAATAGSPTGQTGPASQAGPSVHEAPTSLAYQPVPSPTPVSPPAASPPQPPGSPYSPASSPAAGAGAPPAFAAPALPYPAASGYPAPTQQPMTPPADKPWHQQWWAIGGAILSVLLVGCVVGGVIAVLTNSDSPADDGNAAAAPPAVPTPGSPAAVDPAGPGGLVPGQERTGSGPAIVTLDVPTGGLHTVTLNHTGEGVFHARLLDRDGEFGRGLGGGIGEFSGTYPLELRAYGDPGAVDIVDGDGSWTVTVQELSQAPLWPAQTSGSGSTVLRVEPGSDVSTVSVTHQGRGNIFIWAHVEGQFGDLFVNEIGDWSGTADLSSGTFVLEVDADGDWTIEPS